MHTPTHTTLWLILVLLKGRVNFCYIGKKLAYALHYTGAAAVVAAVVVR